MNIGFLDFELFAVPEQKETIDRCRGNNQKSILILYEAAGDNRELEEFLSKILEALNLHLHEDILLLDIKPSGRLRFTDLCRETDIRYGIFFGVEPRCLYLNISHLLYRPLKVGGKTLLFADGLAAIRDERDRGGKKMSRALWNSLQAIFKD